MNADERGFNNDETSKKHLFYLTFICVYLRKSAVNFLKFTNQGEFMKFTKVLTILILLIVSSIAASAQETKIKWFGQAAFQITTPKGKVISIDLGLINVGGHYGMEQPSAAKAANAVRAKMAIPHHFAPHHFATNPQFAKTTEVFASELKKYNIPFYEMKAGETITFRGAKMEKK